LAGENNLRKRMIDGRCTEHPRNRIFAYATAFGRAGATCGGDDVN
jgi:hypothetical protein